MLLSNNRDQLPGSIPIPFRGAGIAFRLVLGIRTLPTDEGDSVYILEVELVYKYSIHGSRSIALHGICRDVETAAGHRDGFDVLREIVFLGAHIS